MSRYEVTYWCSVTKKMHEWQCMAINAQQAASKCRMANDAATMEIKAVVEMIPRTDWE